MMLAAPDASTSTFSLSPSMKIDARLEKSFATNQSAALVARSLVVVSYILFMGKCHVNDIFCICFCSRLDAVPVSKTSVVELFTNFVFVMFQYSEFWGLLMSLSQF